MLYRTAPGTAIQIGLYVSPLPTTPPYSFYSATLATSRSCSCQTDFFRDTVLQMKTTTLRLKLFSICIGQLSVTNNEGHAVYFWRLVGKYYTKLGVLSNCLQMLVWISRSGSVDLDDRVFFSTVSQIFLNNSWIVTGHISLSLCNLVQIQMQIWILGI